MKLIKGKTSAKLWLFLLAHELSCLQFAHTASLTKNNKTYAPAYQHPKGYNNHTQENVGLLTDRPLTKEHSCTYIKYRKRLLCNGTIDVPYFKTLQNEEVLDFILENYEVKSLYYVSHLNPDSTSSKLYLNTPRRVQKLIGVLQLKDTGLRINVVIKLLPQVNCLSRFVIVGEAFSNKLVQISTKLTGSMYLTSIKNRTVAEVNVETADGSRWAFHSNITFSRRNRDTLWDEWSSIGIIVSEEQYISFYGKVRTKYSKEKCRFGGEVNLLNANLVWTFTGSVFSPTDMQITIPRAAFSSLPVKNIVFKNCSFFNDFDENVFEGLEEVESISFLSSKLEAMPQLDELLNGFTNLKEILIEDCITPCLKFGVESKLRNVRRLSFKGTGPLKFDRFSFHWLENSSIEDLNLKNSYITFSGIRESVLEKINHSLKYLDISNTNLNDESELELMLRNSGIIHLNAEGLRLQKIPTMALKTVEKTLEYLSLRGNNFRKLLAKDMFNIIFNFPWMLKLKELNLMECQINYLERGAFDKLPNLKILHLGYNYLENLQDGWTSSRPQIWYLDLRFNGLLPKMFDLSTNTLGSTLSFTAFQNLTVLNLSNGIFSNPKKIIESLGRSLKQLFLRNIGLSDLSNDIFENMTNLEELDLSYNKNFKPFQTFPVGVFQNLKRLKYLTMKGCKINGFSLETGNDTDAENATLLPSIEYLDLGENNIKIIDSKMLKTFTKLKILNLSGNVITMWKSGLINGNSELEALFLDENKIEMISDDMMSDLLQLRFIKLGNNPFTCGNYVYDIMKIIDLMKRKPVNGIMDDVYPNEKFLNHSDNTDKFSKLTKYEMISFDVNYVRKYFQAAVSHTVNNNRVMIIDWSESNYMCYSKSKATFISFTWVNETFEDIIVIDAEQRSINEIAMLWLPATVIIGISITIGITCWKFLDIHLITQGIRNAVALTFLSRENKKEKVKYDYNVFVSYSDRDRPWVIENLLPRLESTGDVKVCLHERDFQVGLSILENIAASIDNSSNIILVVSKSFLKSQWCQYEMHLAQHRLLENGRDHLILILLEPIPLVKRPKTLRYLMMTKTYLEWPGNSKKPKDIELFWNRLVKSLIA